MYSQHEIYMSRCLQLAALGTGYVAPNPMVGAVLVYEDRILGEGYHEQYGKAHAEVNCINAVVETDQHLISESTLYVSLEPCAHYGKTPPCTDLIIQKKIPRVVIGSIDPFESVNGKGIEKLQRAGVEVITGVLEKLCNDLNRRFFTFQKKKRPHIILKWAQTSDSKIASLSDKRLLISNKQTNRIVHKWRTEEAAILVGTNTAANDNPYLTSRVWPGRNPVRLILDLKLRLKNSLHIFNSDAPTVIFNLEQNTLESLDGDLNNEVYYYRLPGNGDSVRKILDACYQLNIQSILVEGGASLLQSFLDKKLWDETRIITNENLFIGEGLLSPQLTNAVHVKTESVITDRIDYFSQTDVAVV